MERKAVVAVSVLTVVIFGVAGLFLAQRPKPLPANTDGSHHGLQADAHAVPRASKQEGLIEQGMGAPAKGRGKNPADAEAATAYELVEINLRCQVDREASATEGHIRSTTEELCKDLSLEPLSREEVFKAITYAAEHGNIRAQLDYSLYASRIFEDEQNSLDPELIREYKENTVRFLEFAGTAGESQAYVRLSDIYKNGALAPKDPVMVYAYAEAYFRTGSSRYGVSFLNNAASGLDGTQLRRGKEIANQIINKRSALGGLNLQAQHVI